MKFKAFFKKVDKENLFELHPDAILIVEFDGKILDINSKGTTLLEQSRFNITGEFISKYIEDGSSKLNDAVNQAEAVIGKLKNASGEKYVEITASQDAETQKVYVALRDVTQKHKKIKLTTGEFEVAKSIIDEKNNYLTANAPELMSFVNSIESFSKALLDGVGGKLIDKQEKYINIISKNAQDLMYDLDKLFLLFKLESDLWRYSYRTFDIINALNDISRKYSESFKQKKIRFSTDFTNIVSRTCYLDPEVFELIIGNLLEVSLKSTDIGTCTFVASNPSAEFLAEKGIEIGEDEDMLKSYVRFEIKDTSVAMSEEESNNLFNPYTVIKNPQRRSIGAKCTYATVKTFIKHFGGDIEVFSKPAQGTLVSFFLPITRTAQKR